MSLMDDLDKLMSFATPEDKHPAYERLKAHLEATTPWYPPVPEGYGEWIEYKPGDPGPCVGEHISALLNYEREGKKFGFNHAPAHMFNWQDVTGKIVAYCIKKPDTNQ